MHTMKRIHFFLPDGTLKALRDKAQAAGIPMSELVRRLIDRFLDKAK